MTGNRQSSRAKRGTGSHKNFIESECRTKLSIKALSVVQCGDLVHLNNLLREQGFAVKMEKLINGMPHCEKRGL
jgi:hypothetical protein